MKHTAMTCVLYFDNEACCQYLPFIMTVMLAVFKDGDTLIHLSVELGPAMVYVCANSGVPINTQNFVSSAPPPLQPGSYNIHTL